MTDGDGRTVGGDRRVAEPDESGGSGVEPEGRGTEPRQGPDCSQDARDRVADIAGRARERNLGRAAELAAWVTTAEQEPLSDQQRGAAADIAHQLAGSAGTFGYQAATEIAREVERLFCEADGLDAWARAGDCVRDLVRSLHEPPQVPQS